MGIPCFACTPDLFPDLMAPAIQRHSLAQWTSQARIVRARARVSIVRAVEYGRV
jgi:hypothetical protein